MSKAVIVLAMLAALVSSGAAYSSLTSGGPSEDPFVAGGGRFGPGCFTPSGACFQVPRDLSVDAHLEKKGTKVTGLVYYGNNDGGLRVRVDVTCVSIVGHEAAVGGIVSASSDAAYPGRGALIFLRDEGAPGLAVRDRSSPMWVEPLDWASWPAGFPATCPAPDSSINGAGFQAIHSGDIVVSAGRS